MSNCGSKFKRVWELDENGYLKPKFDKDGKQEKINQFQDIQDHFGEVDFKSRLENNKLVQNDVLNKLNTSSFKNDGKVYVDPNSEPFVDLMTNIAKLKNVFGKDWYSQVNKFLLERKTFYENEKKKTVDKKISEKSIVKKDKDDKSKEN